MSNLESYISREEIKDIHYESDPNNIIIRAEIDESSTSDSVESLEWIQEEHKIAKFIPDNSVSAFDVAEYILKKLGSMTTMKLQKLVYYSQAWSLVWDEKPLFSEEIEAWANGPVVKDLFYYHKGFFKISSVALGNVDRLNNDQNNTIDSVLEFYGNKSAQWLIDLTHLEDPWKNARSGLSSLEKGNNIIALDSIANYYSSL